MYRFHVPYIAKNALKYIDNVLQLGRTAYGGEYTRKVEVELMKRLGVKTLFSSSCTSALEYTSLLLKIQPGDEVVVPTYTFPSTANAFALRGAKVVFADSSSEHPNIDLQDLYSKLTKKTKLVLPMYYGGVSVDWNELRKIQQEFNFHIVEEAAHSFGSNFLDNKKQFPLGSLGDLSVFSFHETKNISCGEGGAVGICNPKQWENLESCFNDGTDKLAFERGEVEYYQWCSLGSSFGGSELNAAVLLSQLEDFDVENNRRKEYWRSLYTSLQQIDLKGIELPKIPRYADHNAHIFYLTFPTLKMRSDFEIFMAKSKIPVYPHYRCLHKSTFGKNFKSNGTFENALKFENGLVRLPMNMEISQEILLDSIQTFMNTI